MSEGFSMRVVFALAVIVSIASAISIVGCGHKNTDNEQVASASQYTAIQITNGGTIAGTVRIQGAIPSVPELEINHDNNDCGMSKPSPRLECSASGGVKNAVVYLVDVKQGKAMAMPAQSLMIDQKHCMYAPHILAAPLGASVAVQNSDNVLHNVHAFLGDKSIWNEAQPIPGQTNVFPLNTLGVIRLQCDAGHIWMSGYIYVAENPYYAVTDSNGAFTLANVPPGTYTIACWHEGWSATKVRNSSGALLAYTYDAPYELKQTITVPANDTAHVAFAIVPR